MIKGAKEGLQVIGNKQDEDDGESESHVLVISVQG